MTRIRRYRTDVALARLSVPTHVIRGQRDRIASAQWCAELTRSPLVDLVSVPRAAHMVPLTHPRVVVDSIERIRSGLGGAPRSRVPGEAHAAA
jgi:pimeloyl-ACP methyl ester carboxylesterase